MNISIEIFKLRNLEKNTFFIHIIIKVHRIDIERVRGIFVGNIYMFIFGENACHRRLDDLMVQIPDVTDVRNQHVYTSQPCPWQRGSNRGEHV